MPTSQGTNVNSGTRAAIGIQRSAIGLLKELHGQGEAIFVTPDKVTVMIGASAECRQGALNRNL